MRASREWAITRQSSTVDHPMVFGFRNVTAEGRPFTEHNGDCEYLFQAQLTQNKEPQQACPISLPEWCSRSCSTYQEGHERKITQSACIRPIHARFGRCVKPFVSSRIDRVFKMRMRQSKPLAISSSVLNKPAIRHQYKFTRHATSCQLANTFVVFPRNCDYFMPHARFEQWQCPLLL